MLPSVLASYCTLLQHQFIYLGGTGEIKSSTRRDMISDPFMSRLQDLPLSACLFYLREWSKVATDAPQFALKRITSEFEELVDTFRPEIRIHKESTMKGLQTSITSKVVCEFINERSSCVDELIIADGVALLQPLCYMS